MVSFQSMLQEAYRNRTAVGSFNFYNLETLKGILQAAGQRKVPVIAAFGKKYLPNMRLEEVAALTNAMASSCEVPVCLHLDHCNDLPNIFRAIRSGFTSVMYDGSALPFEENVQNTIRVCEAAHEGGERNGPEPFLHAFRACRECRQVCLGHQPAGIQA